MCPGAHTNLGESQILPIPSFTFSLFLYLLPSFSHLPTSLSFFLSHHHPSFLSLHLAFFLCRYLSFYLSLILYIFFLSFFLSRATRPITHSVGWSVRPSIGTSKLLACKWVFLPLPNRPRHRLPCMRTCFSFFCFFFTVNLCFSLSLSLCLSFFFFCLFFSVCGFFCSRFFFLSFLSSFLYLSFLSSLIFLLHCNCHSFFF